MDKVEEELYGFDCDSLRNLEIYINKKASLLGGFFKRIDLRLKLFFLLFRPFEIEVNGC